jgi:hypothetical protein
LIEQEIFPNLANSYSFVKAPNNLPL